MSVVRPRVGRNYLAKRKPKNELAATVQTELNQLDVRSESYREDALASAEAYLDSQNSDIIPARQKHLDARRTSSVLVPSAPSPTVSRHPSPWGSGSRPSSSLARGPRSSSPQAGRHGPTGEPQDAELVGDSD
jgi:hypothetical protein